MAIEITSDNILTPEQMRNHLRIFAGPGAGKTHFLVENIKNIVTSHPFVKKSRSRKVLCVTYTNAAVEEIRSRFGRFSDSVEVYTIHSFIIEHIIKPFQKDLRDIIYEEFGIDVDTKKPITSQIEGLGILHGIEKEDVYKFVKEITSETDEMSYSKKDMGEIQVDISNFIENSDKTDFKVNLKTPTIRNKKNAERVSKIDARHTLPIKGFVWSKVRMLTHDEILYFGYRILKRNSTALYALRVRFPFVFVDEFQDTNPVQTLLIKLIGEKSTIVGVIGDVAQSIYSFQGARPSQFNGLTVDSATNLVDYVIKGNRRSTANIIEFCNFIRKSDINVLQSPIRSYPNDEIRTTAESKPIHFLVGNSDAIRQKISGLIEDGGVVLTRTWAKAFAYIRNIEATQAKLLNSIYNHYYNSPIDIRAEIAEIGNVTWVRAFKFIFSFHRATTSGSFIDVLKAFGLYTTLDKRKLNIKLFRQIKSLADDIFVGLTNTLPTVTVIEMLNIKIKESKYANLRSEFLGEEFYVPILDEYDLTSDNKTSKNFFGDLKQLTWATSFELFTEVFSKESRYMTVHQAKGLEWDKVVVSVEPNKFDNIEISDVYTDPQILQETSAEEFVRIYYVACSRAKEDLYIHLPPEFDYTLISSVFQDSKAYEISY